MRQRLRAALLLVVAVLSFSCGGPFRSRSRVRGERGKELVVALRPGFLEARAEASGADEELSLLKELASRLGRKLRLVECRRADQVPAAVADGMAHVGVVRVPPRGIPPQLVQSAPVAWVDYLVVRNPDFAQYGVLWLHRGGRYWSLAEPFYELCPVPEEVSLEELAARVATGRYPATIVDSDLVAGMGLLPRLHVDAVLRVRQPVRWLLSSEDPRLAAVANEVIFSRRLLTSYQGEPECRDLGRIREKRTLRVITENSPLGCFVSRGGLEGLQYGLVRDFAIRLGLRLAVIVPPPGEDPFDWLEEGRGDLLALPAPVDEERLAGFLASDPYCWLSYVAITLGKELPDAASLDGMSCACVDAVVPYAEVACSSVAAVASDLDALQMCKTGEVDVAFIPKELAQALISPEDVLTTGPELVSLGLRWVFNVSSRDLFKKAQDFLDRCSCWRYWPQRVFAGSGTAFDLTPWDSLLRWAAMEHGIDWRLLAALMYEESRFDPRAVGPGGSAGLFQFMPATWSWLGIRNPFDPVEAIPAAAGYLHDLAAMFSECPEADRMAMAVASYNVGPRHVQDARKLATRMGLDSCRWFDNVETAMLILDNPDVARRYPAGVCRCRRAVHYTRRVLRRYLVYCRQYPQ